MKNDIVQKRQLNSIAVKKYRQSLTKEVKQARDKEQKIKQKIVLALLNKEKVENNQCTFTINCKNPVVGITKKSLKHWSFNFNRTAARSGYSKKEFSKIFINLYKNQNGKCAVTGIKLTPGLDVEVDHIIPLSRKGNNDVSNFRLVAKFVNRLKNNFTDDEFKEHIKNICPNLLEWATKGEINMSDYDMSAG